MKTANVAIEDRDRVEMLLHSINAKNTDYKKTSKIELVPLNITKKIILDNFGIFSARHSLKIQDNPSVSETKNIFDAIN